MLPLKNARITQEYGRKNSSYRKGYHTGIDIVGGDKTVMAIGPGVILRSEYAPGRGADPDGWGNYIIVRQYDDCDVLYAHLDKVLISIGKTVTSGDSIGIMGSTGNSTGPHLHLEMWKGSWRSRNDINPTEYLGIANKVGAVSETDAFADAVRLLVDRGIISSPDYWLQNAAGWVKGEHVKWLILNMEKYLKEKEV